jgi:inosine-uridine nucleoside N-ribohydrolase
LLTSPWFWISIILIVMCTILAAALGVLQWLLVTLAAIILTTLLIFLLAAYTTGTADPPTIPHLQTPPDSERLSVVYDCDITMKHPFRDVSDGLALLYLLGEPRVDLLGITTTYGNGPLKMTTQTTRKLLASVGHADLTVVQGAPAPNTDSQRNQAAHYLTDIVNEHPGEISLIATGCMTNLYHASTLDRKFFEKLRGLYLMGGTTGPLLWNGHTLAEINFARDPESAYQAIHADCPVTIAPGQAGLSAIFRSPQMAALGTFQDPVSRLILRQIRSWFALMRLYFQDDGFALWDSVAVLSLTHPELFEFDRVHISSTRQDLGTGKLAVETNKFGPIRLAHTVRDYDNFIANHLAAWHRLGQSIETRKTA